MNLAQWKNIVAMYNEAGEPLMPIPPYELEKLIALADAVDAVEKAPLVQTCMMLHSTEPASPRSLWTLWDRVFKARAALDLDR